MQYLIDGHCDLAQGYLLGQPDWTPIHLSGNRPYGQW
jgi:EAL domain-containing protein (putative c-di-GMP-specific phosphodiesterase class I)